MSDRDMCVLCGHYISQWQVANGKTINITAGPLVSIPVHRSCVADKPLSEIIEIATKGK